MDITLKEKVILFGVPQIKREDCLAGLRLRIEQRISGVVKSISGECRNEGVMKVEGNGMNLRFDEGGRDIMDREHCNKS